MGALNNGFTSGTQTIESQAETHIYSHSKPHIFSPGDYSM